MYLFLCDIYIFLDALIDENIDIPDFIDNSRNEDEINFITEEEKLYDEENGK